MRRWSVASFGALCIADSLVDAASAGCRLGTATIAYAHVSGVRPISRIDHEANQGAVPKSGLRANVDALQEPTRLLG
jgi:hypothetical protein